MKKESAELWAMTKCDIVSNYHTIIQKKLYLKHGQFQHYIAVAELLTQPVYIFIVTMLNGVITKTFSTF